jgi:hypothetical protein
LPAIQPMPPVVPPSSKSTAKAKSATEKSKTAKASTAGKTPPVTAKKSSGLFRWTSKTAVAANPEIEVETPKASDLNEETITSSPLPCESGSCTGGSCSKGTCHKGGTCDSGLCTGLHTHAHACWHWYFEATALYLQPRWHDNPAFITQAGTVSSQTNFGYDWEIMPRIEAGFSTPTGLGARARLFYFDADAQQTLAAVPAGSTVFAAAPLGLSQLAGVGDTAVATSKLSLYVIDLEATQRWQPGKFWSVLASAGLRYVKLDQDYNYTELNAGGSTDAVNSTIQFDGAGLTFAMEVRRMLGRSGFNLYALGRGSLLYGTYDQQASQVVADAPFASASRSDDDFLPIAELEAGLGWVKTFHHVSCFLNLGVVGQVYFGAGNSSDSSPTFNGIGVLDPNAQSRRDLSFLGISLTAGLRF